MDQINTYLLEVKSHLHLDSAKERSIVAELYAHLHEKAQEMYLAGNPMERSRDLAVKSMGRPRVIARLFYEVHSVGNVKDAFLTGLPYAVVAVLFLTHLWRHPVIAPFLFAAIVATTLLGWWWGKPNWLYSWIGFALFPLLVAGFSLRHQVPFTVTSVLIGEITADAALRGIGVFLFYVAACWLILSTTVRVARRDWLLASCMLLPLPSLGIWLYHLEQIGGFFQPVHPRIFEWDIQMAAVTALMAISLATYTRLRRRGYRMISLVFICMNASAYITHCIWNELTLLPVLLVSACLAAFLLSPIVVVKPSAKHGEEILQWIRDLESG